MIKTEPEHYLSLHPLSDYPHYSACVELSYQLTNILSAMSATAVPSSTDESTQPLDLNGTFGALLIGGLVSAL